MTSSLGVVRKSGFGSFVTNFIGLSDRLFVCLFVFLWDKELVSSLQTFELHVISAVKCTDSKFCFSSLACILHVEWNNFWENYMISMSWVWDKEKIWVSIRIGTFVLANTGQVLYLLELRRPREEWGHNIILGSYFIFLLPHIVTSTSLILAVCWSRVKYEPITTAVE